MDWFCFIPIPWTSTSSWLYSWEGRKGTWDLIPTYGTSFNKSISNSTCPNLKSWFYPWNYSSSSIPHSVHSNSILSFSQGKSLEDILDSSFFHTLHPTHQQSPLGCSFEVYLEYDHFSHPLLLPCWPSYHRLSPSLLQWSPEWPLCFHPSSLVVSSPHYNQSNPLKL